MHIPNQLNMLQVALQVNTLYSRSGNFRERTQTQGHKLKDNNKGQKLNEVFFHEQLDKYKLCVNFGTVCQILPYTIFH